MEKRIKRTGNPIARTKDLVIQNSADEVLIYDLNDHHALCLNKTSAAVWRLCDGENSIKDIADIISKNEHCPVKSEFVKFAVDQLGKNKLLGNCQSFPDIGEGLSRRDVIRNAVFASAIALPVVSLILAPTVAHAQSCVNPGFPGPGTIITGSCQQQIGQNNCAPFCTNPNGGGANCCTGSASFGTCSPAPQQGFEDCTCVCS